MNSELAAFSTELARNSLSETQLAVALLWFFDTHRSVVEMPSSEIATLLHELSLTGKVNVARLTKNLARNPSVVRGKAPGCFKIKLSSKDKLGSTYAKFAKPPAPKVASHVLAAEDFHGTHAYLEKLVQQINGCYQFKFYDGCIVLCRRLVESLLIAAFAHRDKSAVIKRGSDYVGFGEMIGIAQSGQHVKLARGTPAVLNEIKEKGDAAAHSPSYITKDKDIDEVKVTLRHAVADLMHVAHIEGRPTNKSDGA